MNNPKPIDEKKALSGRFNNCIFVNNADIEKLSEKLFEQRETSHNKLDNEYRNDKIFEYEKEFSGKVQDMFIVDRGHRDGNELHVVKNNGIVEIFNIQKLRNGENSLITKLIARPPQIRRYYTWCDCETPRYLTDIARENEYENRNNW